jgi:hypothetical protein
MLNKLNNYEWPDAFVVTLAIVGLVTVLTYQL